MRIGTRYEVHITITTTNRASYKKAVHCPNFPKSKSHGWWVVLGHGDELLALKRVQFSTRLDTSLTFGVR
jgi:hypothetical protein